MKLSAAWTCQPARAAGCGGYRHFALLGQRGQGLAHPIGVLRSAVVLSRKGNDGHLSIGEQITQRHPGAVIEPPLRVGSHRQTSCLQCSDDLLRSL